MVAAAVAAAMRTGWALVGMGAPVARPEDEEVSAQLALIEPAVRAGCTGLGRLPSEQRAARNVASHDFTESVKGLPKLQAATASRGPPFEGRGGRVE